MDPALGVPASAPVRRGPIDTTLDPHAGLTTAPVRERADVVARAEDVIEVIVNLVEGNAEVYALRHLVRRLDLQGELRHNAKGTESDHRAEEGVSIGIPPQLDESPVRNDESHGDDGGRQDTVMVAGTMGAGCAGSGDREVRDRGHVRQREARLVQFSAQQCVTHAGGHRHRGTRGIDAELMGQTVHQHQVPVGIDDAAERVPGAECS